VPKWLKAALVASQVKAATRRGHRRRRPTPMPNPDDGTANQDAAIHRSVPPADSQKHRAALDVPRSDAARNMFSLLMTGVMNAGRATLSSAPYGVAALELTHEKDRVPVVLGGGGVRSSTLPPLSSRSALSAAQPLFSGTTNECTALMVPPIGALDPALQLSGTLIGCCAPSAVGHSSSAAAVLPPLRLPVSAAMTPFGRTLPVGGAASAGTSRPLSTMAEMPARLPLPPQQIPLGRRPPGRAAAAAASSQPPTRLTAGPAFGRVPRSVPMPLGRRPPDGRGADAAAVHPPTRLTAGPVCGLAPQSAPMPRGRFPPRQGGGDAAAVHLWMGAAARPVIGLSLTLAAMPLGRRPPVRDGAAAFAGRPPTGNAAHLQPPQARGREPSPQLVQAVGQAGGGDCMKERPSTGAVAGAGPESAPRPGPLVPTLATPPPRTPLLPPPPLPGVPAPAPGGVPSSDGSPMGEPQNEWDLMCLPAADVAEKTFLSRTK